jgi:hypothetical protein
MVFDFFRAYCHNSYVSGDFGYSGQGGLNYYVCDGRTSSRYSVGNDRDFCRHLCGYSFYSGIAQKILLAWWTPKLISAKSYLLCKGGEINEKNCFVTNGRNFGDSGIGGGEAIVCASSGG